MNKSVPPNLALQYIICDKYTNRELVRKPNVEFYLFKMSCRPINIFSEKTYRFEFYSEKLYRVSFNFLLHMINYRLENLSDCKTTTNKLDHSILIEYNENNTFLLIKIINEIVESYLRIILKDSTVYGINLRKMLDAKYSSGNDNKILISSDSTFEIEVGELKENLFKCYNIDGIGMVCGKIIFDNVFNNSRSLKNKIDDYYFEDYLANVSKQDSLRAVFAKFRD